MVFGVVDEAVPKTTDEIPIRSMVMVVGFKPIGMVAYFVVRNKVDVH